MRQLKLVNVARQLEGLLIDNQRRGGFGPVSHEMVHLLCSRRCKGDPLAGGMELNNDGRVRTVFESMKTISDTVFAEGVLVGMSKHLFIVWTMKSLLYLKGFPYAFCWS